MHFNNTTRFVSWENAVLWLREQPEHKQLCIDGYYDDPISESAQRYYKSTEWCAIRQFLPTSTAASALDIGAGRGIASYALAKDGFSVTALEPDTSMVVGSGAIRSLASDCNLSIKVFENFSERLPFESESFDLVFSRAVLHHTKDLGAACAEIFRVLKPGGKFIAVREHVISRSKDLDAFLRAHPLHHMYGGENAFRLDVYKRALYEAGFNIDRTFAPFESAVNYSPHTFTSIRMEIASQLFQRFPIARDLLAFLLGLRGVWPLVSFLLSKLDRRPGRLYSFIASRPLVK